MHNSLTNQDSTCFTSWFATAVLVETGLGISTANVGGYNLPWQLSLHSVNAHTTKYPLSQQISRFQHFLELRIDGAPILPGPLSARRRRWGWKHILETGFSSDNEGVSGPNPHVLHGV